MPALAPDVVSFAGLTFSPDGNYVYFVRSDKSITSFRYLYVMPVLGGTARPLIRDIDSPLTFSPDGKQFAYIRGVPERSNVELRVATTDASNDHPLTALPDWPRFMCGAAWSPDGKTILAPGLHTGKKTEWVMTIVNVADGAMQDLIFSAAQPGRPAWWPDGNSFLIPLGLVPENRAQLFLVFFPSGEKTRVSNDRTDYRNALEFTQDGKLRLALEGNESAHIWIAPGGKAAQAEQITTGETPDDGVAPGLGGKLLVQSRGSDLQRMNADGTQRVLLRPNLRNYLSISSYGDRYLLFDSYEDNKLRLLRTDLDGSNSTVLSEDSSTSDCSPDGSWALFDSAYKLYRVPIEGGSPVGIFDSPNGTNAVISPDGKWIACGYQEHAPVPATKIAVVPAAGGAPVNTFVRPIGASKLPWSLDQKSIQYLLTRHGATNVWEQPLAGGPPRPVIDFTSVHIVDFAWSRDGKQLLLAKGEESSDILLVSFSR